MSSRVWLLAITASSLIPACATTGSSCIVPDFVQLEIETSDRMNPDEQGQALPTVLQLYQLSEVEKLEQASFDDLWSRDNETLGPALIAQDQITVFPGQVAVKRVKRDPKADFLAGVALFRAPMGRSWRTVQELPLAGDPCKDGRTTPAGAHPERLRIRLFLDNYRIESVNNYVALPKKNCPARDPACAGELGPDELPQARRNRHLRTFQEDSSEPRPTVRNEDQQP